MSLFLMPDEGGTLLNDPSRRDLMGTTHTQGVALGFKYLPAGGSQAGVALTGLKIQ